MLKQASVTQVRSGKLTRKDGYIAIVMCHYPRGLSTEARDAFLSELAPDRELFAEWKAIERARGHEQAFVSTAYEDRFRLSAWGLHLLSGLSARARGESVYLVCQCKVGERCHREMLMELASKKFAGPIEKIFNPYPTWEKRIEGLQWPLPESALADPGREHPAPVAAG